ncbi:MFS general substrate transporter [Aaosphaeria arxii CBS 175.79]|uniref:MFS general substrate transporter n=1 Tax=Aaosphaeria arxii CBS 175.79 TaxID=1450172 RepID=A0A6A5Y5Y1_9PLEO|nr:MFS general substrate transporter [Aaosphaeria arxii CBS 175.79]KAF2020180.1 MFS general substrate transporter [Aaosphaeria arxii CBS 175.79]
MSKRKPGVGNKSSGDKLERLQRVVQNENNARNDDEISVAASTRSTVSVHEKGTNGPSEPPATLARTISVTAEAVIVERRNRRGLLAHLALIPEVENPYHYARKTKWLVVAIVAFCAMAAPMGSAIVMPVLQDIAKVFNASPVTANMSVAVYMLAMSIFPIWWSAFSETGGRRTIYLISFLMFTVFSILSAVSTNIAMLVVFRTFAGGAAASVQAVGAGTIADTWEPRERGKAMGVFYLGPLCGPLFAPIIGGVLGQELGWRSTQWFLVIYGGITVLLIIFALPETLRRKDQTESQQQVQPASNEKNDVRPELKRVSTRQSVQQTTKSWAKTTRKMLLDPLIIITWMRYPPVALTVYYASITFGSLYFLNISIQATFSSEPYKYSTLIIGLLYIPGSLGYMLASLFGGRWIDRIMQREARKAGRYDDKGKLILRPEDRMRENAWIAAVLWPGALMWYGWTAEHGVIWIVPMIANFFFGIGSMLIFSLATTMLTEFMPKRASAGVAINNFFRNIFSFIGAVVAEPLIHAIGNGWLMTILGLWSLLSGIAVIYTMKKWGPAWRDKMVKELG